MNIWNVKNHIVTSLIDEQTPLGTMNEHNLMLLCIFHQNLRLSIMRQQVIENVSIMQVRFQGSRDDAWVPSPHLEVTNVLVFVIGMCISWGFLPCTMIKAHASIISFQDMQLQILLLSANQYSGLHSHRFFCNDNSQI